MDTRVETVVFMEWGSKQFGGEIHCKSHKRVLQTGTCSGYIGPREWTCTVYLDTQIRWLSWNREYYYVYYM